MRLEPLVTLGEAGLRFRVAPRALVATYDGGAVWAACDDGLWGVELRRDRVRAARVREGGDVMVAGRGDLLVAGRRGIFTVDAASGRAAAVFRDNFANLWDRSLTLWGVSRNPLRALVCTRGLRVITFSRTAWGGCAAADVRVLSESWRGDACLSPGGERVCAWDQDRVRVFEIPRGRVIAERPATPAVRAACWVDDRALLLADERAIVRCVSDDLAAERWAHACTTRPLRALAVSPDGGACAAAGALGAEVLDTASGSPLGSVRFEGLMAGDDARRPPVAVGPGGRWVAHVDARGALRVIDTATGDPRLGGGLVEGDIVSMQWAQGGRLLVSAAQGDPTVRAWDADTGELRHAFEVPDGPVDVHALSPDGERYATASSAGLVRAWDVASGAALAEWDARGIVRDLRWSADGERVVTCVWRDDLHVVACLDRALRPRWVHELAGSPEPLSARWSSDLKTVYVATGGPCMALDGASGAALARWPLQSPAPVACAEVVGDGEWLVKVTAPAGTGARRSDGGVRLIAGPFVRDWRTWNIAASMAVACDGPFAVDPGARWCAFGVRGRVDVWSLSARERVLSRPLPAPDERVTALSFSLDGARFAVGTSSGVVRLFRVVA